MTTTAARDEKWPDGAKTPVEPRPSRYAAVVASTRALKVVDQLSRPLRSLRLSVTDRCNLRCRYCMPEVDYVWLPRGKLLDFDELCRAARLFGELGASRLRLTGGEPLLRRDLPVLIEKLGAIGCFEDLALTTNGILLRPVAQQLRDAGLMRITISLDTLRPDRFKTLTRVDALADVLKGVDAACDAGFDEVKIDTVALRGFNDDELAELVDFGRQTGTEVRFIEYMDVGGATAWKPEQVLSREDILQSLTTAFGSPEPLAGRGSAPAERFALPNGTVFGVIASTTAPFCQSCDRCRLTADGMWYHCLYASCGIDLKTLMRTAHTDEQLLEHMTDQWRQRQDRGAEMRVELSDRGSSVPVDELRDDPHLEMHTRGG